MTGILKMNTSPPNIQMGNTNGNKLFVALGAGRISSSESTEKW